MSESANYADYQEIQDSDYLIENFFHDGSWFRFPLIFLQMMTIPEALLLAYLLNHSCRVGAHTRRKKWRGWFYCQMWRVQRELHIAPRTQQKIISLLIDRGLLSRRKHGPKRRRYFKIDLKEISKQTAAAIRSERKAQRNAHARAHD